jgi:signal transduction histidine kinase/DNA-binding response OmpR family regulator
MILNAKIDGWLHGLLLHPKDTPDTIDQKVYLVGNMIIPTITLSIAYILFLLFNKVQLFVLTMPLVLIMIFPAALLIIIRRGIGVFLTVYYGIYMIMCSFIVIKVGGLPNSFGVWGGAFICFMHTLAICSKRILVLNACIYILCLIIIVFSYPYLNPVSDWTPEINNLIFTYSEIWMCLFLVKVFYDSIVARTKEAGQKAKHLQELDLLKSKLYANITHEFRTPLTLIRGNAEEISDQHADGATEKAKSIIRSSDKILFLVNQMLNLSKIEEGNVPMHYIQGDLVAFVKLITGSFRGYADFRKVRLHFEAQPLQLIMDFEKDKLEESLANLMSNAIKFTPVGGDVFVSVRQLSSRKTSERKVEISVRDTGIGISEDKLDKIFIRFYQVEDNSFPGREGTGIGLTLVNEYVKLMRGTIEVKSSPGIGSEFIVTLPVTNSAAPEEFVAGDERVTLTKAETGAGHEADGSISGHPLLLIIEDNAELTDYLIRLLGNDYRVLTAENGIYGVELAIEHIPDIILSDVMMPGKDGYQVCRDLKNDFRTSHIPIVFLTARADAGSRLEGVKQGADAWLTKPFNRKELMICLHNLLVQREVLRLKYTGAVSGSPVDEKETGLNEKFLERVTGHLEENYRNDRYGIDDLRADLGVSRIQLHRKLTALTGQSASNFIRNFRLQKARKLLLESGRHVSEIAYEVGFRDANYFSRSFIQEFGMNATKLREMFIR